MNAPQQSSSPARWSWQFWVAVALVVAFVALAVAMLGLADGSDQAWQRRVYVFGAVEAVVFTAVGWLFGREVHRAEAETAKSDAADAKREAETAREEAKRNATAAAEATRSAAEEHAQARTVAATVRHTTIAGTAGGGPGGDVSLGAAEPARPAAVVDLKGLLEELYGTP
jgi:hypothetical protein